MREAVSLAPTLSTAVGALLVIAAIGKMAARDGAEAFVADLGMPKDVTRMVIVGVVSSELLLGAGLLSGTAPLVAGIAAFALAATFLVVQVRAFWTRTRPCNCFGVLTTERSHAVGLMRAVALLAASAVLVASAATSAVVVVRLPDVAEVIAGLTVALTIVVVCALLDQTVWFNRVRVRPAVVR
jgi:Methylamine utilisation protein MauE